MGRVDWPRRVLTVLVGIPTALQLLLSPVGMWGLATFLCVLCVFEFATNISPRISGAVPAETPASRWMPGRLVALSVAVCAAACTEQKLVHDAVMLAAVVASCCFHIATARRVDLPVLSALLLDLLALGYIVGGFGHAILLRTATRFGLGFQILGLSCAWVCDSGALIAGNLMGHTKLAPVVSPGKTVVGAIAGVASAVGTVLLLFQLPQWTSSSSDSLRNFLPNGVTVGEQVALGVVLGALCILGDLVESLLKRVADVKDSGAFFPGHGGCLDRMDSFLFVAPVLYYYSHFRFAAA